MNKIDFSQLGGFPLDEEALDFLQVAHADILNSLFADAGNTPTIISGMVQTFGSSSTTISTGLFYYNGELYHCQGATVSTLLVVGQDIGVTYGGTTAPAIFENGATHNVYLTRDAVVGITTLPGINFLPWSTFKRWHSVFGSNAKTAMATINTGNFGAAGYNGTLNYIKNRLTNTLHIWGFVGVDDTTSLPATPVYETIFTLPAGFIPNHGVPFIIPFRYSGAPLVEDDSGVTYVTSLNAEVNSSGDLNVGFIKPNSTVQPAYSINFNLIIPLD